MIGNSAKDGALSGAQLKALLTDPKLQRSLKVVFSSGEMRRLKFISSEIAKLDPKRVASVGPLMDSPANRLIEVAVRLWAAKTGGKIGAGSGMGGSIQSASIATTTAQRALRNLTNDRARQLLKDAIEHPALFKAPLSEPKGVELSKAVRSKLAPYLTGAMANAGEE